MTEDFVGIFNQYERRFGESQGADAREFRGEQRNRWASLFNYLFQRNTGPIRNQNLMQDLTLLQKRIDENLDALIKIDRFGDEWVVYADIPLLNEAFDLKQPSGQPVLPLIGAIVFEASLALGKIPGIDQSLAGFNVIYSGAYAASQMQYAARKIASQDVVDARLKKIEISSQHLISSLEEHLTVYREHTAIISDRNKSDLQAFAEERQNAISEIKDKADKTIEAHLNARQELEKIRRPVDLWSRAAKRHRRTYWFGLSVLIATIASAVVAVVEYINPALNNLAFVKDNVAQPFTPASTLTLATMAALIAAAGFVLKIAGRFVTNSLTLAEDAEVRAALADTFLGLTAEDIKSTDEARAQARTVMLAALFRPLPGHQQEDITAPTVLSLAQDLLKKPS